jgi:peptide-methionine (S)-S-oxide reductase
MKQLFCNLRASFVVASLFMPIVGFAGDVKMETAIFAGGCFWCMEHAFDEVEGVNQTISGFVGGDTKNPTYKQVSAGGTGHAEAVKVEYDPSRVSYSQLLDVFWRNIDPTVKDRQFCDHGSQYRSGIFYLNEEQKRLATASRQALEENKPFKEPVVTAITQANTFYPAEDYHQNYHSRNPIRYKYYVTRCGRYKRLEELWGAR